MSNLSFIILVVTRISCLHNLHCPCRHRSNLKGALFALRPATGHLFQPKVIHANASMRSDLHSYVDIVTLSVQNSRLWHTLWKNHRRFPVLHVRCFESCRHTRWKIQPRPSFCLTQENTQSSGTYEEGRSLTNWQVWRCKLQIRYKCMSCKAKCGLSTRVCATIYSKLWFIYLRTQTVIVPLDLDIGNLNSINQLQPFPRSCKSKWKFWTCFERANTHDFT